MKPERDTNYLQYIASLPCCVCGAMDGTVIYHHVEAGGVGTKCSDYMTIPLCADHHTGDNGIHPLGRKTWAAKFGIDAKTLAVQIRSDYVMCEMEAWPV